MRSTLLVRCVLGLAAVLAGNACRSAGGDGYEGDGGGDVDPRCQSLCIIEEPEIEGAYDVCSEESAELCRQECAAYISGASALCAACLLEDACFDTACGASLVGDGPACDTEGCVINSEHGSCTYPVGDVAAMEDCIRQVFPRRTVSCETEYRPVTDCTEACRSE